MRLPWSGILWCPAGCPVHISTAGKTGRNSQTTKSRHCQLLTKLPWGVKGSCACLLVCALLRYREGEQENENNRGMREKSICSIILSKATSFFLPFFLSVFFLSCFLSFCQHAIKAVLSSLFHYVQNNEIHLRSVSHCVWIQFSDDRNLTMGHYVHTSPVCTYTLLTPPKSET